MTGQRPLLGVTLIVLMASCFGTMDSIVRWLGGTLPVLLILTVRYAFQAIVMALWLAVDKRRSFRSQHPRFQALRGVLLAATSALSFYGVQHMPVPEFAAINMLTPVLVTLLAAWLLKEHVSRWRWALVIGGFAGAIVVIRPGSGLFGWAVLFPIAGAFTYATFQLLTSRLSALESPYTTHFWTGFVGTAILLPILLLSPVDIAGTLAAAPPATLALLLVVGALGTGGHLMLIFALGIAPTATLMPFVYVQIAAAAACSYVIFGTLPDAWGWVGMAIISVCGAASAWLNVRSTQAAKRPLSTVAADTVAD